MDKVDLIAQQYSDVWKSRSAFFSWLKGIIRKGWNTAPQKTKLLVKHRKQIPNPSPKGKPTVWGADCSICKQTFPMRMLNVDHKGDDTARLTEIEHIQACVEKLLLVVEDDLRIVCKTCHNIITHSQKIGCTFEQAAIEKQVITFKKMTADQQKKVMKELSLPVDNLSKNRQDAYRKHLQGLSENKERTSK